MYKWEQKTDGFIYTPTIPTHRIPESSMLRIIRQTISSDICIVGGWSQCQTKVLQDQQQQLWQDMNSGYVNYGFVIRLLWVTEIVINYCWLVLTVPLHVMVQCWMRSYLLVCWGRNVFDKEFWIQLRKELTRLWVIVINHFFNSVITTQLPFLCLHCTLHCMN